MSSLLERLAEVRKSGDVAKLAEAECYRVTHSVAFTRAFAHHGDAKDPIAAAAGTFMLGTKGEVTRPQTIGTEVKP